MKYIAHINVMPLKELLDPQGKAVSSSLHNLGMVAVHDVRIGKHIVMHLEAPGQAEAEAITREACRKLLANQVMESFEFTVTEGN